MPIQYWVLLADTIINPNLSKVWTRSDLWQLRYKIILSGTPTTKVEYSSFVYNLYLPVVKPFHKSSNNTYLENMTRSWSMSMVMIKKKFFSLMFHINTQ